jgi:hypothetical protein
VLTIEEILILAASDDHGDVAPVVSGLDAGLGDRQD